MDTNGSIVLARFCQCALHVTLAALAGGGVMSWWSCDQTTLRG